jgi:hypothetical protein
MAELNFVGGGAEPKNRFGLAIAALCQGLSSVPLPAEGGLPRRVGGELEKEEGLAQFPAMK